MNAAVRGVVKVAASRGLQVLGVNNGFSGLIEGRMQPLTRTVGERVLPSSDIEFWGATGGTILGSAREPRFTEARGRAPAVRNLEELAGLVIIGGNGSLTGAHALAAETDTPIVGIPASIDHDVGCTGASIGVDTALNTIMDACDRICDTARAHHRAFVVEVMGRDCGYLAMASAVAVGADAVMFREQGRDEPEIVAAVEDAIRRSFSSGRDKRRVLILKAEGVKVPCTRLVRKVQARIAEDLPKVDVRATVLGHLVRGGHPSFRDRMIAARLGLQAVGAILDGRTDCMVAWQSTSDGGARTEDPSVKTFALEQVIQESQALVDGTSPLTRRRVQQMQQIEGILGL